MAKLRTFRECSENKRHLQYKERSLRRLGYKIEQGMSKSYSDDEREVSADKSKSDRQSVKQNLTRNKPMRRARDTDEI